MNANVKNQNTSNVASQIITAKPISVQIQKFDRIGNNIPDGMNGAMELIMNGYSAALVNRDQRGDINEPMHVDVSIVTRRGVKYLYVKNSGIPADLKKVLDYGEDNHDTQLNQFGTGFKSAVSYFNPTNDGWAFYTTTGTQHFKVQAPYQADMEIFEISEWPFEEWVVSCVEIRIDDESRLEGLTKENCGYYFAPAIINDGFHLTFNGRPVRAIMPKGHVNNSVDAEEMILDKMVHIQSSTHVVGRESDGAQFFPLGYDGQGVYLYINGCFASYLSVKCIHKKQCADANKGSYLQPHPSMNALIAVINIETPADHSLDVPFNNNKTTIKWQDKIGKAYREIIDQRVGDFFRTAYASHLEREQRKLIDTVCKKFGAGFMEYECEFCCTKSRTKEAKFVDAAIGTAKDERGRLVPSTVKTIVEFKPGKFRSNHVDEAIGYHSLCYRNHGINPDVILVGWGFENEALGQIQYYGERLGIRIDILDMNEFSTTAMN